MIIELTSGAIINEGKEVFLHVEIREGDKCERKEFTLPRGIFEALELPLPPAEITRENVFEIMSADEQYRAIKKAFDILAFGRNSVKTLIDKLRHRGFSDEVAAETAAYMERNGYIKENGDAEREALAEVLAKQADLAKVPPSEDDRRALEEWERKGESVEVAVLGADTAAAESALSARTQPLRALSTISKTPLPRRIIWASSTLSRQTT